MYCGLEDLGFEFRQGQEIFLFNKTSKPALGPSQPPIQCKMRNPRGAKRSGCESDNSPPFSAEFHEWSCTSTPSMCLYGVDNETSLLLVT